MRNSILITCHYPDLGSASDWLKRISLARITRSTTQMWVVTGHQYGISAPVPQTSFRGKTFSLRPGNEVVGGRVKERSDTSKTNDFPWLPSHADYFSVLFFQCGAWSQARKLVVASGDIGCFFRLTLESFRFKDEDDYEYEIQPGKFHCTIFLLKN